jgi:hypothetical protein
MSSWLKIKGTQTGEFQLGFDGPLLKNNSGNLSLRNTANSADVSFSAANITASGIFSGNGAGLTNIPGANVTGQVGNALVAGTVYTASQPNITSVGTLTSVSVNGNANVGNLYSAGLISATGNVTANNFIGNLVGNVTGNVTGNVNGNISGNITAPGSNTQVIFNDNNIANASAGLTFDKTSNLLSVSGNIQGGNLRTAGQLSVGGNANIGNLGITGVFATTLSATGNANVGNIGATNGVFTNVSGNGSQLTGVVAVTAQTVTTNAQPNITSVGTLTTLSITGNANVGNIGATNGVFTNITGNGAGITGVNAVTAQTVTTNAQPNITSVGTLLNLDITGNAIVGGNLVVNGNLTYLNVETLAVEDPIIQLQTGPNGAPPSSASGKDVGTALNYYDTSAKVAFMGWDVSNAEFAFGSNVAIVNEVVTFTSLGNVRANYFIGDGSLLTNLNIANGSVANANYANFAGTAFNVSGSNVTGQVGNALVAGTVYTNAQPNITSVGTLTSVSVSGNANVGNLGTEGLITAGGNVQGGNLRTAGQLSVGGNANIGNLGVTGVFATTLSATGNANVANIGANNGVFTNIFGNGAGLTSIPGGNVTGQVPNALVAGTVYTNAQPNITSVGTLTGLTVNGISNLGAIANVRITGGNSGFIITTDGTGNLNFVAPITGASGWKVDSTTIAFGAGATTTAMTLPANAIVDRVSVIVDTIFNGTAPTLSVGLQGGTGFEYAAAGDVNLKVADRYDMPSQLAPVGTAGTIQVLYSASGSTAGSARVLITYAIPE